MATAGEVKKRIRSVKNISQITRALEAVSASRVRKAQARVLASRAFAEKAWEILLNVQSTGTKGVPLHPLLTARPEINNVMIVLITSDRGLAGAFNSNIIRVAQRFAHRIGKPVRYVSVGKKGRDSYNLYYWYYGTLAMYQHGGDAWYRWNAQVRDAVVRRQRDRGHSAGSWDPDVSPYGAKGGRVYCTALAALSLEVYYRYLRLYDEPKIPPALAPARPRDLDRDPAVGRRGEAARPTR